MMNTSQADRTRYIEIDVQSALTRMDSARMPDMKWSLNPYRGCKHGCVYCYARYTHTFLELDPDADFAQTVFVKRNLVQALRNNLRRPTWRREHVSIGTATDPYQPAEGRYQLTRGALLVLRDQLTPAGLVTKNTLALRDAEIMASLARAAGFQLLISITTLDEALARRSGAGRAQPPTAVTRGATTRPGRCARGRGCRPGVARHHGRGGATGPLFEAAYDHGADIAFYQPLHLYSATRHSLFTYLQAHRPDLLPAYQRAYATAQDPPQHYRQRLHARIERIRQRLAPRRPPRRSQHPTSGQLSLL